jgi:hypothetical protein
VGTAKRRSWEIYGLERQKKTLVTHAAQMELLRLETENDR